MHSILTENAETRGEKAALNFMSAHFRPVAKNLSVTMSLYSALTDSRKTVFCFSMSNSEKHCSFILKKFRKSLESSSFNTSEWVNFFLSLNHFFDQNSLFWGEFWSNDSVVRASPVFWNLDRNGAMLNETAITTVLTWSDEEIGQCGSNPPSLNRWSDWVGLEGV